MANARSGVERVMFTATVHTLAGGGKPKGSIRVKGE
jgi:hypothetical protein